jgi:hypothetical protein
MKRPGCSGSRAPALAVGIAADPSNQSMSRQLAPIGQRVQNPMSSIPTDATVSAIVEDLVAGASLPWPGACFKFSRAIHHLRLSAFDTGSVITENQRVTLEAAVRTAQPAIVGDPASPDLRIMVCALHVVIGEWANPRRTSDSGALPNVFEAFVLMRMLDNYLDSANLQNVLLRKRAEMAPEQWRWLGAMAEELYPLPVLKAEPLPFTDRTLN